ncbi:hypothetical protein HH1059_04680 [Halorhodospira halochloris]|uniref:Uncharacterized protein n=1 Tax=Halorhodospira halochloris TaxID=1052 RepID=A0A0X8X7Q4_HALHR|nr:hypothetical protein [Halorhodospira halochloris]MBK1651582.1 hypothetical protein [Halorhodospira halochloris]MCG5548793.1 hypothetical protein [Halorhodospira halochloris]BAU57150.1 hypothetical protein HH1059_04680 [Halorhodospira halochloris]
MLRHKLSLGIAALGAAVTLAMNPVAAAGGPFGKGFPIPGDGYRLIEAELIDRRTGRFELWQQHHDKRSIGDEMATFANLNLRRAGNWQAGMGLGSYGKEGEDGAAFANVQAKQMWREPHRDGYGLGWAAGMHYDYSNERRHDHYLVIPATVRWGERTTLHANLGATHNNQTDDTEGLWALGMDFRFTERWDVILQLSDNTEDDTNIDGIAGISRSIFNDLVQLDLAYGREFTSGAHDEYYFGIRFDAIRF